MKQITKRLLATALALLCLLALAACSSEDDDHTHSFGEWTTITTATCTQDGSEERICDTCGEKETRKITATGHSFTVEKVKEEALKAAATCVTANEYYKSCVCGVISDSETFFDDQALGHNYVKNVCTRCNQQQVKCDHTQFHEETIDLSQYGICTEKIVYQTCICRQVNKLYESVEFDCWFNTKFTHVSEKENKDLLLKMEGSCPLCGLIMYQEGLLKADPVTGKRDGTGVAQITMKKGDEVIFEATMEGTIIAGSPSWLERQYRMIDLAQYGACEGVLFVRSGYEQEYICDLISGCNIDLDNLGEPKESTDANGIKHIIYTAQCDTCGLKAVADQWTEKVDECTSLEHSSVSITCGDKTIFTSDDQTHEESHQWEITDKKFLGETCYDGVKLNYTCSVCNASETHITFYHSREDGTLKDYVSSTCDCVNQSVAVCKYCDKVTNIEIFEYAQFHPAFVRKDITDSAGEVIGEKYSFTCPTCQMKYVLETKTVANDSCHSIVSTHQYVYDAQDQCLLDVLYDEEETTTHKCDYQYYMLGEDCDDGYFAVGTCENCKQTDIFVYGGHEWEDKPIDLSQYGCCQNEISCRKCKVCGEMQPDIEDPNCKFETTDNRYTDDNGVEHVTVTIVCSECGLTLKGEGTITKDGCTSIESYTTTISKGETVVWTMEIEETFASHDYKDEKKYFVGDDCSDGVYIVKSCQCGEQYIEYVSYHQNQRTEIDLDDLGFCGVTLVYRICNICGAEEYNVYDHICQWQAPTIDTDGYEVYQCAVCHGMRKVKTTETVIDDCHTKVEITYIYQGTIGEPYSCKSSRIVEDHDYQYEYHLTGETCADGWTRTGTCSRCGVSEDSFSGSFHVYTSQNVSLSEYGFCDGMLRGEICDICGSGESYMYDNNCQWQAPTIDTDGYEVYQCAVCHGICKVKTTETVIDDCHTKVEITYIYQGTIGEPYSYKSSPIEENHDYQYEYHLTGETCEDGWTEIGTCSRCDVSRIDPSTHYSHDFHYEYHLTGETCEDGWTATETCSRCGVSEDSYSDSFHVYTSQNVSLSEYGFCDGMLRGEICDICGSEKSYRYDNNCQWQAPTIDTDGYEVYQCAVCHGIYKVKTSETVINDCHTKVETSYIYQGTIGDPYSCKSSRIVGDHGYYNYEYHLTGETCADGWTRTGTCSRCGATGGESSGSYHVYTVQSVQYVYLNEYGLCGGSLEIGECQICHGKDVFDEADCNWQYKGTNSDGYQVSECSNCHITKLYKNTVSEKADHCYCTYETTIIYRNGTTELYSITAAIKEPVHDYSYTYDPETPDCTNDEWHGYTATCKNCNHTETVWYLGHHVTYFNYIDLGDCGCFVAEDICNVCHEIVKYSVKEYDTCSWEYKGTNAEDYDVRVCSECGLIIWTKFDENTYQKEYIFYDKDNKELYRCTT